MNGEPSNQGGSPFPFGATPPTTTTMNRKHHAPLEGTGDGATGPVQGPPPATHAPLGGGGFALDASTGEIAHRDLGLIAATETDGITINRTRTGLSPFVEIRKERLIDRLTSAPSKAFGIWVPDPASEGGWKDMGTVSESYLLLTNREVRDLALEIAERSRLPYRESRVFWDGARFAHVIDFTDTTEEVAPGDGVGLSLITRTSYDRSWRYEAALMGKRFLCDNGALSGEFFARVSFRHATGSEDADRWKEVVRQGLSVVEHAGEDLSAFVSGLRRLKAMPMEDRHLRAAWKAACGLGDGVMGKVMSRYVAHEEPTLYGLLNAGTNVLWHNGKMTAADFANNDAFTTGLLRYANEHPN